MSNLCVIEKESSTKSQKLFKSSKQNLKPINAKAKIKNALNFDYQKTIWSYLVPTRRNLDFHGIGGLNFDLSKWRIFTNKILVSLYNSSFFTLSTFNSPYYQSVVKPYWMSDLLAKKIRCLAPKMTKLEHLQANS